MHPAFASNAATLRFGLAVACCLALPVILDHVGLPSREQAFSAIPAAAGPVGLMKDRIYDDSSRADVLFVGSSLVKTDVLPERLAEELSRKVGHPMKVETLELNWFGADQQYFMLKDYLDHHPPPRLVVLHVLQMRAYNNGPHPQAYRWLRYGDLPALPARFPWLSKLQLYGEMVLGAPRQLLALIRPNLIRDLDGSGDAATPRRVTAAEPARANAKAADAVPGASLLAPAAPVFEVAIPSLRNSEYRFGMGPYTLFFLDRIARLVQGAGSRLVLMHVPLGLDAMSDRVQEIEPWGTVFGSDIREIAVPKRQLFEGVDPTRFYFPGDVHMNPQGGERFTDSILEPVAQAYLSAEAEQR